jgi:hypothetical protein
MKRNIFKHAVAFAAILVMLAPMFLIATSVHAQAVVTDAANAIGLGRAGNLGLAATEADPRETAVTIIKYLMTFLGIIAVTVILIGGFRWMTAAGNEDKVGSAKKTIIAGAIGLVIVLAAFAIVTFVVKVTGNAITGQFGA